MTFVISRALSPRFAVPVLLGSAASVLFGAGFLTRGLLAAEPAPTAPVASDPCGLPAGVALEPLAPADRGRIAVRQLVCRDRLAGRIGEAEYRATIQAIDDTFKRPVAPPQPLWATSVIGFSSQYATDSWSAQQVLGAPDVFPAHGDQPTAWASASADDADEWIEVGFEQPRPISAVEVYETFNPGAVAKVELVTTTGRRIRAFSGEPHARGPATAKRVIDVQCTTEPIAAVRVELGSRAVAGWNELDAIGVVPCK